MRPEQFQTEPGTGCRMSPDAEHRFLDAYEKRLLTLTTHRTSGRRVSFRVALGLQAKLLARRLLDRGEVYLPLHWK